MKYKIALIGCGRISFKHIEAFVAMQDKVELIAVCDPVVDRAEEKKPQRLSWLFINPKKPEYRQRCRVTFQRWR